jgi:RNA polymerase sigma-32 factor
VPHALKAWTPAYEATQAARLDVSARSQHIGAVSRPKNPSKPAGNPPEADDDGATDEPDATQSQSASDTDDNADDNTDDDTVDDTVVAELVEDGEVPAEVVIDEGLPALKRPSRRPTAAQGKGAPLARYDPLQAYMRDVQRYKLLTPVEEREAATLYFETGDVEAAARLVTANLRLVVKIAYDYRRAHKNLSDLIQEGSIGLMQAVKKYDPYKGVKLSTYAAWWIRAYILRFILNNARLVKVGTTQAQRKLFFNLKKEKARLAALGIDPTPETIAKRLEVPTEDVVQMDRRLSAGDMSLDAPIQASEGSSQSRIDFLPAVVEPADSALADAQMGEMLREKLDAFAKTLRGKDAQIFEQRMLTEEPRTLQELGDEFGVSRERVRQLEKRLQMKLKQFLADELGEGAFGA